MNPCPGIGALVMALFATGALSTEVSAQQQTGTVPVTVDNFIRAEIRFERLHGESQSEFEITRSIAECKSQLVSENSCDCQKIPP